MMGRRGFLLGLLAAPVAAKAAAAAPQFAAGGVATIAPAIIGEMGAEYIVPAAFAIDMRGAIITSDLLEQINGYAGRVEWPGP